MPWRGSRKNRRAYRLRWFRLRWWREARALPRQSRALQAWACGSRVAFDAQFGVNDFELRLDGHFSVEKARTWWPNHGKYLDNGRKLILLYAFSPVIGDFPWKSCNFAAKIGLYAKLNYWSQRRNRSAGEVYGFQLLRVHSRLWAQGWKFQSCHSDSLRYRPDAYHHLWSVKGHVCRLHPCLGGFGWPVFQLTHTGSAPTFSKTSREMERNTIYGHSKKISNFALVNCARA